MVEALDPRFEPVARGAGALERLCCGATWSEGPVWMHEDGSVLWSDIPVVDEPNGLAFSPDESVLYVTDTSAALRRDGGGHHQIWAFDVVAGQDLANPRIFAVVEPGLPDGIRVEVHGFIYSSSADAVQVYHPDGARIGRITVPEKVGNLCFGGPGRDELYLCASTSLYRIRLGTRGLQRP